jgi:hypothetical protein
MKRGRSGTMTHDYIRHGTTTLFAALNLLDGMAISQCLQRHRNQEFLRLERDIPAGQLIHAVLDNTVEVTFNFDRQYTSHKHPMPELGSLVTRAERSTSPRSPPTGSTPLEGSLPCSPAAAASPLPSRSSGGDQPLRRRTQL